LDPRSRIVAAVAVAVLVALAVRVPVLLAAWGMAATAAASARLRPLAVFKRLAALNCFMLLLLLVLPWTVPGPPWARLGPVGYSRAGVLLAATIALKGNAIMLVLVVLLGTLDITTMGHALHHLRVPEKLSHLLLFTVRYVEVLEREYRRLSAAMKMRGFRPGLNGHTYRSFGYLVGMLLVLSVDRSERIVSAMKCRGFRGKFYLLDHFTFSRYDLRFAFAGMVLLGVLAAMEWFAGS
jgi:cobalt/nickel transport system permease protein